MTPNSLTRLLTLSVLLLCMLPSRADGLADLKAALSRLQGQTPLKAQLEVKTWRRQGEGKDAQDKQGAAALTLEDNGRGLQLMYGKDLLARVEAEQRAQLKNKEVSTPALTGLRDLEFTDLRGMSSAAASLAHAVEDAVFLNEVSDQYAGKPVRRLNFEVPLEKLPQRERKYVRELDAKLSVWIAADGTPLASTVRVKASGRAFIVVRFKHFSEEDRVYSVLGDRLLLVRKEERGGASGAGESQEYKTSLSLQPV